MKVKILSRNPDEYMRETTRDLFKVPRNFDPVLHPFEAAREYTKAVNAVKLDKVFAKPFIGQLDGHKEGVSALNKHTTSLSSIISGDYDGEVRLWNLPMKNCTRKVQAHDGSVRGVAILENGERFISIGDDKTLRIWNSEAPIDGTTDLPINTIVSKTILTGLSYNKKQRQFATCGDICQIWDESRNEPLRSFQWGVDSVHWIAYNPVERHLLGTCAGDRSTVFYDIREKGPVRRVVLSMRSNQLAWNPMEAYTYTVANEDYNLYTFDMRRLSSAVTIHKGHISAVIAVDYSPTGLEIVSGSYDRTIRIFGNDKSNSRDVYHTKRMQRITNVLWSADDKYILSSSDEMNVRIWKARASEKLGVLKPREKNSLRYNASLLKKFEAFPQVKRIARHRHVPKYIYGKTKQHRIITLKEKRKEANRRAHSKPGSVPFVSDKVKPIVQVQ
ncbi:DDB1- and CUL4-associated factor 13 [Cimex lectularius]|uniref:DDB1- and CUL4-associated factor 13 n=1 Tax=Cimex lectularius TaxID=79782 RepID=A0A8I6TL15_CIMLE|nr:DDB1- and CUL4-associated factor 13 [Cimex lectularius]